EEKDLRLESSIGILNDKVGSGKTFIILSLLMISPTPHIINTKGLPENDRPIYFASDKYITIREIECKDDQKGNKININVIMVPKGIQHQWEEVFKDFVKKDYIRYVN